jgi:hypothetical protein
VSPTNLKSKAFRTVYYVAMLTFSLKLPVIAITGPYVLSLIGFFSIKGLTRYAVIGLSVVLLYFIASYFLNFRNSDMIEFFNSYINIVLFISSFYFVKSVFENHLIDSHILNIISLLIFGLAISQVFMLVFFKDDSLYFIFDSMSISTAENVDRFQAANFLSFVRPVSIYHEPSFLALINLVLLHIGYIRTRRYNFVNVACIFLSMSIIGIASLFLYIIWNQKLLLRALVGLSFIALAVVFSELSRLGEVFIVGSSGHERLVKPFIDLVASLNHYMLAVPVGNLFPQSNNSLQVLLAYFGVMSWIFIPAILVYWRYFPVIFCILFTNGAFLTPDGGILLASTLYAKNIK